MNRWLSLLKQTCPPVIWTQVRSIYLRGKPGQEMSPLERELHRLFALPHGVPAVAQEVVGRQFQTHDGRNFVGMYVNYFQRQTFRFTSSQPAPLIIDGGANEGVGVAYWKSLYPDARVLAFEPDPRAFAVLQANCSRLENVTVHPAALWIEQGPMAFFSLGDVRGHLACLCQQGNGPEVKVEAVRLRDYLVEPVALLKLDIEGAEVEVLADCADRLHLVDKLFVEYHSFANRPQGLAKFFEVLEQAGFRVHAHSEMPARQPFLARPIFNNKDFRLNVFCFRE